MIVQLPLVTRMIVIVRAMILSKVIMVVNMRHPAVSVFMQMFMKMFVRMNVHVLMGMSHAPIMEMFMGVGVAVTVSMQMPVLMLPFHR